jgi:hypothetical protein
MSDFSNVRRTVVAAAFTAGLALAGTLTANADPATTGSANG